MAERTTLSLFGYHQRLIAWCLLPLAAALVVALVENLSHIHADRQAEVRAWATGAASLIEADLQRRIHGLQALSAATAGALREAPLESWHEQARSFDRAFDAPVLLVDAHRDILLHSREPLGKALPSTPPPKGRAALAEAVRTGAPAVGDRIDGLVLKQPLFAIAVPMVHRDRPLAWLASVPLSNLSPHLQARQGWSLNLRDSVGDSLAHTGPRGQAAQTRGAHARSATVALAVAPWTVTVEVEPWLFYRPHLQRVGVMVLGVVLAASATLWAARRASWRLGQAVGSLVDPQASSCSSSRPAADALHRAPILEVEAVRSELLRLGAAVERSREAERQRIAHDLHDGLQQHLASVQIALDLACERTARMDPDSAALLARASSSTHHLIREVDHIVNDLRPPALDDLGLVAALEVLAAAARSAGDLQIELEVVGPEEVLLALPPAVADSVYRVAQECLNNVRKHARAGFVHLTLDASGPASLLLQVSDDGVGLAPADLGGRAAFGLDGMRRRVEALGGSLSIARGHAGDATHGTTVRARYPRG